ncbi:MAG: hypothetical protein PWP37_702 [Thermotogota bacterium]|nr:hypothetical protein [Thermotogota bacterium]MDK2864510.1 hypothetical protein [Thermotogota bacterium]
MLLITVVIMAVFMVVNIFFAFRNRTNYSQVYYRATYSYDYEGTVRTNTTARLAFEKYDELLKAKDSINNEDPQKKVEYYQQAIDRLSQDLDRTMKVVSFNSSATVVDGLLQIVESSVITGFATLTADGIVDTNLGPNKLQLTGDSKLIIEVPEDAVVLSVSPTPTEELDGGFVWQNVGTIPFPTVRFRKPD